MIKQTFKFCTDDRFSLILDAVTRISKSPNSNGETLELGKILSFGESVILSLLIGVANQKKDVEFTEADLETIIVASDRYLAILDLIGIPIMVPRNRMNQEQIKALDDSVDHLGSLCVLIGIWKTDQNAANG